ncbi:hypothetical protein WH47_05353 [Habropoda laboriosa]|uniref:Mos1 transposase HTH domain-containing protein n=1 Tax=Habropoda laboriosa TaxID=597456 RepID=A0A0L7QTE5_9HYME|nr:hypothetical protein WH47_05353 [Habropoda laboriosa]
MFFLGKKASCDVYKYWFRRFKQNDFEHDDREPSSDLRKCGNKELRKLLHKNPTQTQEDLAEQ